MFVRWKKRMQTKRKRPTGNYILNAVLVKSERRDGQVRQEFICHLGSIRDNFTAAYWHQHDFWETAIAALDRLPIAPDERARIEQALEKVVTRPTPKGRPAANKQYAAIDSVVPIKVANGVKT